MTKSPNKIKFCSYTLFSLIHRIYVKSNIIIFKQKNSEPEETSNRGKLAEANWFPIDFIIE